MSYEYDVFFSYKRDPESIFWHRRVRDLLRHWLTQSLGGSKARIFMDEDSIDTGDRWKAELINGLQHSKCLVPVWSPEYFHSKWCLSEWKAFRDRESLLQIEQGGLIVPIKYCDGEHFPPEAQDIQMHDFSEYTSAVPAFWDTRGAVELDGKIRSFAEQLAKKINCAPAFAPGWPAEQVMDVPVPPKISLANL